jgi:hypothetical protein
MKNIRLKYRRLAAVQIAGRNFGGEAEIDADDMRSPAGGYIGETSHATADVQHQLAGEIFRAETGAQTEIAFRDFALVVIQLCVRMYVPLEPEAACILLSAYETNDPVYLGIDMAAADAAQVTATVFQ